MFQIALNSIWVETNDGFIVVKSVDFVCLFESGKAFFFTGGIHSENVDFNSSFEFSFESLEFFVLLLDISVSRKSCEINQSSIFCFENFFIEIGCIDIVMIFFVWIWATSAGLLSFFLVEFARIAFFCFFFLNLTCVFSKKVNEIAQLIAYGIIFNGVDKLHHLVFLCIVALLHHNRWEAGDSIALLDRLEILWHFLVVYLDDVEPNLIPEFSR